MVSNNKSNPYVSVVMPVFNGARYISGAIDSILTQDYQDFEFIVVDDGSTDQTASMLSLIKDPRLKVITHKNNMGIVTSLNDGVRASKGKYIARMDSDDLSDPKRFSIQVDYLDKHRDCAAVGSFVRLIDPAGKTLYTIEQPTRDLAIKSHLLQDSCIAHGSVMMRKSAIEEVGLYNDSSDVVHAEDYDLFVRFAAKYKLANVPEYLYVRIEHDHSISHIHSKTQQQSARYISQRAQKLIRIPVKPLFSILMPTHNKARYIKDAIESVQNQTFRDFELVIIDDKSTDNTAELVMPYLVDPRIIFLQNPQNLGKSRTRNRLVKESLADIFGELDSDDTLTSDAISNMYQSHIDHPKHGYIYSQFVYCDKNLKQTKVGFCRSGREGETNLHAHYASAFRTYKREYFNKTSGFDVTLSGAEDIDMVYKIEEVAPILFVDKIFYNYRLVNDSKKDNFPGLVAHAKAKIYAYRRRLSSNTNNISLLSLIKQIANMMYSYLKQLI